MERERSGSLGSFIHLQAFFLSLGKSYIASLAALRLKITIKSHTMCFGKKPKAIEISTSSSPSDVIEAECTVHIK